MRSHDPWFFFSTMHETRQSTGDELGHTSSSEETDPATSLRLEENRIRFPDSRLKITLKTGKHSALLTPSIKTYKTREISFI